ncbi:MAG TPA: hypothetical protein VNG53_05190 [Bacteroidia bacterium]|nr:hypothetical protein [Bacteroidia bacterium]
MENTQNPIEKKPEEQKSRDRVFIIIIILLLFLCGILGWQYWVQKNRADQEIVVTKTITVEKDNVKADLLTLQTDYAGLKTNNTALQAQLDSKRDTIAALLVQAEKYKDDAYIMSRLRKEANTLREIMKGYVVTIDSLNTLNQHLTVERDQANQNLKSEKGKTEVLNKENENLQTVVNTGSILQANGITAEAVHEKSGGKRESETSHAKRTDKIKVSFTIAQNNISRTGNRDIYLRIISPDGKELSPTTDQSSMFEFQGGKGFFAGKQSFNYQDQQISLTMYGTSNAPFVSGKYIIDIYADKAEIGQTTLTLK